MKSASASLILLYLLLAIGYSLATPPGEGPDEPGHAKYVFFLAREGRLPVQCAPPCVGDVPGEGHQPPLAYALMAPALLWLPREERTFDLPGNRDFVWLGGTQVNAAGHGSREFWPWDTTIRAWRLVRLVNILSGAVTVWCVVLAGRVLAGDQVGLLAGALVAFNPQFLFTSGLITNDGLLTMLSAILSWLLVLPVGGERRLGRAVALGAILGLALITKQSALLYGPLVALWGFSGTQRRDQGWWRIVALRWMASAGVAILIAGWWYLRNWQVYGDPLGLSVFQAEFATQPFVIGKLAAWTSALWLLFESFWARFGWMNLPAPDGTMLLYGLVSLVGLSGVLFDGRRLRLHWVLWLTPVLTMAWLVSFALTAGLVAWQGRLLFPALPALAVLLAAGLQAWRQRLTRPGRPTTHLPKAGVLYPGRAHLGTGVLLIWLLGQAAWMPIGVIRPAYPYETLPAAEAVQRIANPVYGRFAYRGNEGGAILRSVKLDPVVGAPHQQVSLLWEARARQNRGWWVFIHLVNAKDEIVAEANGPVRNGRYPMDQWVAGDWIEDGHLLELPAHLPAGQYLLRVGLWDERTGQRVGRWSATGRLQGDSLDALTLHVGADGVLRLGTGR